MTEKLISLTKDGETTQELSASCYNFYLGESRPEDGVRNDGVTEKLPLVSKVSPGVKKMKGDHWPLTPSCHPPSHQCFSLATSAGGQLTADTEAGKHIQQ